MASVLNKFEEKTKILASKVNENFEFLQKDIATVNESIAPMVTNIKETILADVQTVKESLEESLQGLENLPHIIKVSEKSLLPSWYIVYSNGWCEQGGHVNTNGTSPISFLIPYLDTNYTAICAATEYRAYACNAVIQQKTTTGLDFHCIRWTGGETTDPKTALDVDWHTRGYIDLEEFKNEL